MKNNKNRVTTELAICAVLWVLLIALKRLGISAMSWPAVLLGFLWIPALWWILTALLGGICLAVTFMGADVIAMLGKLKARNHKRKKDRRVIKQAKAAGVWDKPQCLGGRALELKAWKEYKIKREPGEKDENLRSRCIYEMLQRCFERRKITRTVKLKERPTLRNMRRWCESAERVAEKTRL